jgi:hypothetical protein
LDDVCTCGQPLVDVFEKEPTASGLVEIIAEVWNDQQRLWMKRSHYAERPNPVCVPCEIGLIKVDPEENNGDRYKVE